MVIDRSPTQNWAVRAVPAVNRPPICQRIWISVNRLYQETLFGHRPTRQESTRVFVKFRKGIMECSLVCAGSSIPSLAFLVSQE